MINELNQENELLTEKLNKICALEIMKDVC